MKRFMLACEDGKCERHYNFIVLFFILLLSGVS